MALDLKLITLKQVSGGFSDPAPAYYQLNYGGDMVDLVSSVELDTFLVGEGVNSGDGVVVTTTSGTNKSTIGKFETGGSGLGLRIIAQASFVAPV